MNGPNQQDQSAYPGQQGTGSQPPQGSNPHVAPPQGGHGGGMPPQPEKKGPSALIFVIIGLLVIAIAGVLLWMFVFNKDDGKPPAPAQPPAASEPTDPNPSDENLNLPADPSPGDGEDFEISLPPGTLPETIGAWQYRSMGIDVYLRDEDVIVLMNLGTDATMVTGQKAIMSQVQDFTGGFCGTLESDAEESVHCVVSPGKAPNNYVQLTSAGIPLDDILEVGQGIVSAK